MSYNINSRIFGAPMPEKVQKTLEQRQLAAASAEPGDSIDLLGNLNFGAPLPVGSSLQELSQTAQEDFAYRAGVKLTAVRYDNRTRRHYLREEGTMKSTRKIMGGTKRQRKLGVGYDLMDTKIYAVGNHVVNNLPTDPNEPIYQFKNTSTD